MGDRFALQALDFERAELRHETGEVSEVLGVA